MTAFVFNIAKGKVAAYYDRVKGNDPATSALVLTPIEATGLEAGATLQDAATVAVVVAGTTNKQSTMGEKVLTDASLAAIPSPDNTADTNSRSLPEVTWAAATGNDVGALLVSYRPDTGAASDATDVPLTMFTFMQSPSGADITLPTGVFFTAS